MINSLSDLELTPQDDLDTIESKIKEKLGINFSFLKESLSTFVKDNAPSLAKDTLNIIPYGDYGNLLENFEEISNFLQKEACKIDNWQISYITPSDLYPELIQFVFDNSSIDEGDNFQGYVFVSKQGKVKHVFAQFS